VVAHDGAQPLAPVALHRHPGAGGGALGDPAARRRRGTRRRLGEIGAHQRRDQPHGDQAGTTTSSPGPTPAAFGSPYTAIAARATGATVRFADIDPFTHNVSVARCAAPARARGRRIERVLVTGALLVLVEDAAQAHALAGRPRGH